MPESGALDRLYALVLLGVLSYIIVLVLQGLSRLESSGRKVSYDNSTGSVIGLRRAGVLFSVNSLIGLGFSFILLGEFPQNWLGVTMFILACGVWVTSIAKWRHIATWQTKESKDDGFGFSDELDIHRKSTYRSLVLIISQLVSMMLAIIFYFYLGGSRYFSLWDLAGFSFYVASSTLWQAFWRWEERKRGRKSVRTGEPHKQ
jgi:hypothetical protein